MRLPKVKGQLKSETTNDGLHLVFLAINYDYAREFISLNLTCRYSDWDTGAGRCHEKKAKGKTVSPIARIINNELDRHSRVAEHIISKSVANAELANSPTLGLTAGDIKEGILQALGKKKPDVSAGKHSLFDFIESEALAMEHLGAKAGANKSHIGTARRYRTAAKMFRDHVGKDIAFEDLTADTIRDYYQSRLDAVMQSTAYVSVRVLKTLYRRGIRRKKLKIPDIFLEIESNEVQDVRARAKDKLTDADIKKISDVKLSGRLAMSRDLFLFCYYNAGTRVRDAILMQDMEVFKETKTGNAHSIFPKARRIIDRYKGRGKYVFGYIDESIDTPRRLYNAASTATTQINRDLKEIAKMAGLSFYWQEKLSSHIARHTAIIKIVTESKDIFMTSKAVGHANPKQTAEYLKTHSPSLIDEKIAKVMDKL